MLSERRRLAYWLLCQLVLILVLVEHALGVLSGTFKITEIGSLNPCFSGTCSRSASSFNHINLLQTVLILVLVEHALGATMYVPMSTDVLILVLVEHALGASYKTG